MGRVKPAGRSYGHGPVVAQSPVKFASLVTMIIRSMVSNSVRLCGDELGGDLLGQLDERVPVGVEVVVAVAGPGR